MDITHDETGRTIRVVVDNVIYAQDGCQLAEALFSGLVDLTSSSVELAARLHPTKAEAFEWIIAGQCSVISEGKPIPVVPDILFHVNNPQGGSALRHFSEFLEQCRKLRNCGQAGDVRSTISLFGFEPRAEPVLREMHDGSLLLVFASIPPIGIQGGTAKLRRFHMNTFGTEIERAVGVPVVWDDRDVFVIRIPEADTIERVRGFLQGYWGAKGR
jgi:hypothetical protein